MTSTQHQDNNRDRWDRALRACLDIGKLLISTLELREVLQLIMNRMSELIEAENWSLFLRDAETGELTFEVVVGVDEKQFSGFRMARGEGIAGQVAETGVPLFIPNVREDPRFSGRADEVTGFSTESIVCVPLSIHGKILGGMEIVNVKDMGFFEERYLPILTILADYAAIAIENAQLFSRIARMNITDEYTGLYNARYLHQELGNLLSTVDRAGQSMGVVFVDMDNFKSIVDTFGHMLGTRVLKEVGQTMAAGLSSDELLIKYGGDEFIMLLPGKGREEVVERIEAIRSRIQDTRFLASEPGPPPKITASFGIAIYPEDAVTKKDLLLLADKAMYSAKARGKNLVSTAVDPGQAKISL